MRWLWLVGVIVAVLVAVLGDLRWVIAVIAGLGIYRAGMSLLGGMAVDARVKPPVPTPVEGERTVYTCAQCGTEVVLVVRGEEGAPRHCGETMEARTEVPRR